MWLKRHGRVSVSVKMDSQDHTTYLLHSAEPTNGKNDTTSADRSIVKVFNTSAL